MYFIDYLLPVKYTEKTPEDGCYLQSMLYETEFMINEVCNVNYKTLWLVIQVRDENNSQFI